MDVWYEIYPSVVKKILKDNDFKNEQSCFDAWKDAGLINYEEKKNTRKRMTDPFSDKKKLVVVFRIFADKEDVVDTHAKVKLVKSNLANKSKMENLLKTEEEDDNDTVPYPA